MDSNTFSRLIENSESDVLDFKIEPYDLGTRGEDGKSKEKKRAQFAKDMLSFANIWRDQPRHVIIGAKREADGKISTPGITSHLDGADLVQALEGLVHPCPRFHYSQVQWNERQFGVIEIKAESTIGPFFATKNVGGGPDAGNELLLRSNTLYCRRDSRNVEASPGEQQAIWRWFRPEVPLPKEANTGQEWTRFVELAQLGSSGCHFILILALKEHTQDALLANLAAYDWSMVIDFDSASQETGALRHCHDRLAIRRSLHIQTPEKRLQGDIGRATYWYFANGLQVGSAPAPTFKHSDWIRQYGKLTAMQLEQFAAGCSGPVSVVALCEHPGRVAAIQSIIEAISSNVGVRASFVAITHSPGTWEILEQLELASVFPMSVPRFLSGSEAYSRSTEFGPENVVQFPSVGGVPKDFTGELVPYLEEDLELVHLAAGLRPPEGVEPSRYFMSGGQISWFDLGLQADVERSKTSDLKVIIEKDLDHRRSSRVNLYHHPGSGGTTVARRVLWTLHQRYPTVVLHRCVPGETAERISKIYQQTGQPVLVMCDGGEVSEPDSETLYSILAGSNTPFVILQVLRRYQKPEPRDRNVFLSSELTPTEIARFRIAFEHAAPTRKQNLDELASGAGLPRTPFIFGLTAFAANFSGLTPYVQNHLDALPEPQRKLLQYLALAHEYGQQALATHHFAELLQLPTSRPIDFRKVLSEDARGLLIEQGDGRWRPVHQLVSSEILKLTLSTSGGDTRLWKANLGELTRDFVTFCRTSDPVPPEDLQSIIEQILIRRTDSEVIGGITSTDKLFTRIVNDLPGSSARLRLFEHVVEEYPGNSHFWAHLGRYLSIDRRDFKKAEDALDRAIALSSDDDHVVHHMKGMILRNLAFQLMSDKQPIGLVVDAAKKAVNSFEVARRIAPEDEHGYRAEVQTILKILDYARAGKDATTVLATENSDPWLREGLERVESLLSTVRIRRQDQSPSQYEERCRADLDALYGAPEKALQRWDHLLQRRAPNGQALVYAPPIRRQIVWLQLARCERRWEKLTPKMLQRALSLLEENIQQEPEEDRNVRLWLQGARFQVPPPSLTLAADLIATWRMRGDSLESNYYLFVMKTLEALDGSIIAASEAQRGIETCRARAGFRRDRTRSLEWLGKGEGLQRLVHQDQLGIWDDAAGFYTNPEKLQRIRGIVRKIRAPQSGEIELPGGLRAFFVPALAGMSYGRDENRSVSIYLGFSYEGLRAWGVVPD